MQIASPSLFSPVSNMRVFPKTLFFAELICIELSWDLSKSQFWMLLSFANLDVGR